MKLKNVLVGFTLIQIVVVWALMLWRPVHHEADGSLPAHLDVLPVQGNDASGTRISRPASDRLKSEANSTTAIQTNAAIDFSSPVPVASAADNRINFERPPALERQASSAVVRNGSERSRPIVAVTLPVPTAEQMEQALAVPLAFVQPPAEAGFNEAQAADLAQIASQFNAAVAATGQGPIDPAYAATYEEFRNLADEQVRAVSGDGAYEALVDARAQAAGNVTPVPGP